MHSAQCDDGQQKAGPLISAISETVDVLIATPKLIESASNEEPLETISTSFAVWKLRELRACRAWKGGRPHSVCSRSFCSHVGCVRMYIGKSKGIVGCIVGPGVARFRVRYTVLRMQAMLVIGINVAIGCHALGSWRRNKPLGWSRREHRQ